MKLSEYTLSLLDDIERRIDPETEEDYRNQWKSFWNGTADVPVFRPYRKKVSSPSVEIKNIAINDALSDYELMLDSQLADISGRLSSRSVALGMRANYGTGIMSSLFGAEIFIMPRETNTLPTTKTLGSTENIRRLLEKGVPDFYKALGGDALRFGEICAELFRHYPKIERYAEVYHPDTQGPLDLAELLWGGEMFYAMYDEAELVHGFLRLITDTYRGFMDKWYEFFPQRKEICVHWGLMHKGAIMLRLDSGMNISEEFYNEFSKPYDRELLDYYNGGCLHFCGRGDHYVPSLCEINSLYGLNIAQPHLNDMSLILNAVSSTGKRILGLNPAEEYADKAGIKCGIISG